MTAISRPCLNSFAVALLALAVLARTAVAQVLPPPPASASDAGKLSTETRLFVRGFRFEGNTAFSDAELADVTKPFSNRDLTMAEIEEARRAVTLHYINHGYVTSGAVIPDQDPVDGIVVLQIVEGKLIGIETHGNKWLRDDYITSRIERWAGPPLNMNDLKQGLQVLRQNPNVSQVNAELKPGAAPGEGVLDLRVRDQQPFRLGLEIDNHRPPSVGAEQITLRASDLNLTGHSDILDVSYGIANSGAVHDDWGFSDLDNVAGSYALPVNSYDTTLGVFASRENTSIVEEPFSSLDIESETVSYGVFVRHPVYQTANREAAVTIAFDRSQNDTTELGQSTPVSPGADANGRIIVSALRISQEWIDRSPDQVLALRSTFNIGLDVLDASDGFKTSTNGTTKVKTNPNGTFFSWVGQGQYIRRLFDTQNQLILRLTGQWTDQELLALEQFSVGGSDTVRGYRENQLVRDSGIISSVEFRLPILFDKTGAGIVSVAPFFDYGGAWNIHATPEPDTIYSAGVGLLIAPNRHINAQLYWGHRLDGVNIPRDDDVQDLGLHFSVKIAAF